MTTSPPGRLASTAFLIRLMITCLIRSASTLRGRLFSANSILIDTDFCLASSCILAAPVVMMSSSFVSSYIRSLKRTTFIKSPIKRSIRLTSSSIKLIFSCWFSATSPARFKYCMPAAIPVSGLRIS